MHLTLHSCSAVSVGVLVSASWTRFSVGRVFCAVRFCRQVSYIARWQFADTTLLRNSPDKSYSACDSTHWVLRRPRMHGTHLSSALTAA